MSDLSHSPLAQRLREVAPASWPERHLSRVALDDGKHVTGRPSIGRIVDLPRIPDQRGNLTFIEGNRHIPFEIRRTYYLYDVPGGSSRGGHGHRALQQLVIAMAGSFDIVLDNGVNAERYSLNRSYYGLYIPAMTWRELDNFSSGAVCLVLASDRYDEGDYFRDYDRYLEAIRSK